MPYGTILTDVIQSSTAGTPPQFNDGNSAQIGTLCRAWVNFNGTTSPGTIRAQFNVSSVTKNSTGNYTINLTNALADTNYSLTGIANGFSSFEDNNAIRTGTRTTSSLNIGVINGNATAYVDAASVQVAFFR